MRLCDEISRRELYTLDELEAGGFWWLPGREDRMVPGILTFDQERGGRLTLIGALMEVEEVAAITVDGGNTIMTIGEEEFEAAGTYDRILGEADGKLYTLEDCFETHRSGDLFTGTTRQVVRVNRIYQGMHFNEGEVPGGNRVTIDLDWLAHWTGRTGITGNMHFNSEPGKPHITMNGYRLPDETSIVSGGGSLTLRHGISLQQNANAPAIGQQFTLEVSYPGVTTAENLIDVASDLQDLVSIGTGRTAAFNRLAIFHPDGDRTLPTGSRVRKPINVFAQWTARRSSSSKPLHGHDLYFTLNDLGGMPTVARWLKVAEKHRDTLGRVMATRYETKMYVTDRYLNRMAALEAFNRKEAGDGNKKVSLERRLNRCAYLAGQPIVDLVGDVAAWIKILKSDRDDIAHHFGRRMHQHTAEQLYLAESAYWLYVLCLLRLAGAPDSVFNRIIQHQEFQFLRRRLAKFLPSAT